MARQARLKGPEDTASGSIGEGSERRAIRASATPAQESTVGSVAASILELLSWETAELKLLKQSGAFGVEDLVRLEVCSKILKNLPEAPAAPGKASTSTRATTLASISNDALEELLDASTK